MFRYNLTVPSFENDGTALTILHAGLERRLTREFGGLTVLSATGLWGPNVDPRESSRNALTPCREDVVVYVIDTDRDDAAALLTRLAGTVRRAAAQDAVYLTRQPIETLLVLDGTEAFA